MSEHQTLKDHFREARIFRHRVLFIAAFMVLMFLVLFGQFYNLQVLHHSNYVTQSERNRIHVRPLPPTRGLIYDRNGQLLADNRPSYTLNIIKESVDDLEQSLDLVAELIEVSDLDREKFYRRLSQRRRPYESVPLRYRLSEEEIARIAVNEYRLPGVEVEAQLVRYYPLADLYSHSVGYVGRINERELTSFTEEEYQQYAGTYTIGKIGLERQYETQLLGEVGYQNVETNARGRVLRVVDQIDPKPGENLHLYLDSEVQKAGLAAMEGRRGAIVAIEVDTGGVVAMVSSPSYNPNLFVTGISHTDYNALTQSRDLPLFNRAIQGEYPPGSTVKPMIALGGLYYQVIDPSLSMYDRGYYQLEGEERRYRDWKRGGHGQVNMRTAIRESCDTYYYELAFRMGIDRLHTFGSFFGLGRPTGIDIPSERSGNWPSREWKRRARGLPWFPGDTLNVGIGQGDVLATPLQLAAMTATIANRGRWVTPRLVQEQPVEARPSALQDVPDGQWDFIIGAMEDVVHHPRGTAHRAGVGLQFRMAGKSGTAQVVGIAQDEKYDSDKLAERHRDHALFVGFAPADDPQIAVAVIVENGEGGSSEGAPVVRKVIEAYLHQQSLLAAASADVASSGGDDVRR
ncbi:penicillin-binding protein 2 [Halioxenophilus sp. WMMB6]|uniref:penicillin-binding protein 2 n=1 Tax=Halioxenophilus sp. WMMB6 TaxID=3073815 RepID=UPI00295E8BE8|nr:penicillin-binding protein 2 [Halioxenophilus sp. WMMB6]